MSSSLKVYSLRTRSGSSYCDVTHWLVDYSLVHISGKEGRDERVHKWK